LKYCEKDVGEAAAGLPMRGGALPPRWVRIYFFFGSDLPS